MPAVCNTSRVRMFTRRTSTCIVWKRCVGIAGPPSPFRRTAPSRTRRGGAGCPGTPRLPLLRAALRAVFRSDLPLPLPLARRLQHFRSRSARDFRERARLAPAVQHRRGMFHSWLSAIAHKFVGNRYHLRHDDRSLTAVDLPDERPLIRARSGVGGPACQTSPSLASCGGALARPTASAGGAVSDGNGRYGGDPAPGPTFDDG
jgi:hypothetical protein